MATMTPSDAGVDNRAPPLDLSHHLSRSAKARKASSIKQFYKYFTIPGIGQLAGGLPNNNYFPFDTLEAKVARPDRWQPTSNKPVDPPNEEQLAKLSLGAHNGPLNKPQDQIEVPHTSKQVNPVKKIDLDSALQYGTAQGYPPLYYFIRQLTREHVQVNCPYKGGPEVILTCGNTDGWSKVVQTFTNEWFEDRDHPKDREGVLCEEFAFGNAVQIVNPRGLNLVPVAVDEEGMLADGPGGLGDVLDNWDHSRGKIPHLMYTVTMGQNPTSGVLSLQRRRDIYALCQKYDILICEDDPYWYLQFPTATAMNTVTTSAEGNVSFNPEVEMFANGEPRPEGWKSSGYKFLDSIVPSSVNIDTDGRVIRLDTFSKTVAPGCRLGWITAQPALIERILRLTEGSTQQPSGFVQSMIGELLLGPDQSGISHRGGKGGLPDAQGWKADGWIRWVEGLRGNYERRMNKMASLLDAGRYAVKSGRRNSLDQAADDIDEWSVVEKTELFSFNWPLGGMFIWMRVHFEAHPLWRVYKDASETQRLAKALWLFWTTKPYLVLASPGTLFSPTEEIRDGYGWQYFRLCFAAIDAGDIEPVTKRLTKGIQAFFRIKDKAVIEKLLKDDEDPANVEGLAQLAQMLGPC
ncbi:hypothetical protein AMS68_008044 [Peltaster fructicola]|uniref:Aminotransferase class I/classII domain-containing protein n=1 Tax=Peltaster fructicola TaxID=286661 RepID=A0A6H0Y642_9PEZI|nr:hypothetical protein AMS68_008044 [Peltaster fructicola]